MNALKYIRKFFSLDMGMLLLMMETFLYLAWARFLVWLPFAKIAPSLGSSMKETPHISNQQEPILKKLSIALHMMSRHTLWDSKCLVRAIAAMKMLDRRLIDSTLYLGTAKDVNGEMIAHAWLRSGTYYLTGAEEMRKFTVVGKFAKRFNSSGQEGSYDE
ncbi:lasso peptide biosynthesis B2 protein [Cohnella luojiensis]|uniref:Lasso peptide biosynthesis B2 protein n=1 Tax=Cohnella luojiensis TaxID=652876 RepID=A0A4Y8LNS6_9BACL|nr:lasso peptide biosynthesis B2 protein [Cohnella luojiensis]TFE22630.1 lasso peptide biosynthesis B2 protein [Cohnella luojiensis]